MLPNHATQTDPYLHEIKGASTATAGQVPIANGAGGAPFGTLPTGGSGSIIKTVMTKNVAMTTSTSLIPFDNTIPQIGEGIVALTAASYTPTAIGSTLRIEAQITGAYSVAAHVTAALFQDATANALAAVATKVTAANDMFNLHLVWDITVASLTATVFKVNAGGSTAGTITINGDAGGAWFGGVAVSSITITEIKA